MDIDAGKVASIYGGLAGQAAQQVAHNQAERAKASLLYRVLPRFLHPLVPGHGGSVLGNLATAVKERLVSAMIGCALTLFVAALLGVMLLSVVGAVVAKVVL
jgi:hypothetical protein